MKNKQTRFFQQLNLIRLHQDHWLSFCLVFSLIALPFGFMTYKGLFGYLSAACFLISLSALLILPKTNHQFYNSKYSLLITLAFSAMIFSTGLTQVIHGKLSLPAYDGPIRMLMALPIAIAIYQFRIHFSKILYLSFPMSLIVIFYLSSFETPWGDRLTSPYLDPIFWGNFSIIIGFMSFASIQLHDHLGMKIYKAIGLVLGVTMSLLSQSRAGWIAAIIMTFVWLIMNRKIISFKKITMVFFIFLVIFSALYFFVDLVKFRIDLAITEALNWYNQTQSVSSVGIRLTMWKISLHLFSLNPWLGYGDFSSLPVLNDAYITSFADPESIQTILCCGPHNEIAANAIKTGIFGICALLMTYFIPMYVFLQHKNTPSTMMGLMLCTGVFVCGFFTEMLSLKIGYGFYAIMTSGLLATTLWQQGVTDE